MINREKFGYVGVLFATGVLFAVMFTLLNSQTTVLIKSSFSHSASAQVFWNSGDGFSENQSAALRMLPGKNSNQIQINDSPVIKELRLDPSRQEGRYFFSRITLSRGGCILLVPIFCAIELTEIAPVRTNQGKIEKNDMLAISSSGTDSSVIWSTEALFRQIWIIHLINAAFLGTLFALIGMAIRRRVSVNDLRHLNAVANASWSFLLYPVYWICQELSAPYFGRIMFDRSVFFFSVFIFFSGLLLEHAKWGKWRHCALRLNILVLISALISPEILFHLGVINQWRFGAEPSAYHWKISRTFDDNFNHSSLRYQEEITEIGALAEKGAKFLSDRATSLYIVASENLYLVNSMPHHRTDDSLTKQQSEFLCNKNMNAAEFDSLMRSIKAQYIVINSDEQNSHVAQSCLTPVLAGLVVRYPHRFNLLFSGSYLSLYQLVR